MPSKLDAETLYPSTSVHELREHESLRLSRTRRLAGTVVLGTALLVATVIILLSAFGHLSEPSLLEKAWNLLFAIFGYGAAYIFQNDKGGEGR